MNNSVSSLGPEREAVILIDIATCIREAYSHESVCPARILEALHDFLFWKQAGEVCECEVWQDWCFL